MHNSNVHRIAMLTTLLTVIMFVCCANTGKTKSYEEMLISRIDHDLQTLRHRLRYSATTVVADTTPGQNIGSTYIRWGQNSCPRKSKLVYEGYAAGKKHDIKGGGTNHLCMTKKPEYTSLTSSDIAKNLYGVETDINGFNPSITNKDLSCAVCYTPRRTSVLMIPGQKSCPSGWTQEYWGYLMSQGAGGYWQPTEYICTDHQPVGVPGGDADNGQSVVYLVGGMCGSLKFPPYVNGKPLTCVVCSR